MYFKYIEIFLKNIFIYKKQQKGTYEMPEKKFYTIIIFNMHRKLVQIEKKHFIWIFHAEKLQN